MKATFFSVVALAASAMAGPCAVKPAASSSASKTIATATATGTSSTKVPVATGSSTKTVATSTATSTGTSSSGSGLDLTLDLDLELGIDLDLDLTLDLDVDIQLDTKVELVSTLEGYVKVCENVTATIDLVVAEVSTGKLTKEECAKVAIPLINKLISSLTLLVTGFADIEIDLDITLDADITSIVDLIVKLITTVTVCLKNLVVVCGLTTDLTVVLKSCFGILGKIVTGCGGFVTVIIPTLEIDLKAIIVDLSASVLAPCLDTVLGSVNGLTVALDVFINL